MQDNKRKFLIQSFLAIPESSGEAVWLLEKIREEKAKASTLMDESEHFGAMEYSEALEDFESAVESQTEYDLQRDDIDRNEDPDLYYEYRFEQHRQANEVYHEGEMAFASYYPGPEERYYADFNMAQNEFRRWLLIEEELYESVGFECCFDERQAGIIKLRISSREHKPSESVFLRMIVDNVLSLVINGNANLYAMLEKVRLAEYEYVKELQCDPEDRSEETFSDLRDAQIELDQFLAKMVVCWEAFQELLKSPKIAEYIPDELIDAAPGGDRTDFVVEMLELRARKTREGGAEEGGSNEEQGNAGRPGLSDEDVPF